MPAMTSVRPATADDTVLNATAGGKMMTVRSVVGGYPARNVCINALAAVGPLFIFQLAARTGRFIRRRPALPRQAASFPRETRGMLRRLSTRDSSFPRGPLQRRPRQNRHHPQ